MSTRLKSLHFIANGKDNFQYMNFPQNAFEGVPYCRDVQVGAGISSHGNPEGPGQQD